MRPNLAIPGSGRKIGFLAVLLLAGLWQSCASVSDRSVQNQAQLDALLTAQADRWDKAIVRKDRAAIEANMAPDFRQIDGYGNVLTKDAFVTELVSPALTINPYTVEDFNIRHYGDVALLSGVSRLTGRSEGKKFESHYRYIDIYVRRQGEWKIVSVQISKIPQ